MKQPKRFLLTIAVVVLPITQLVWSLLFTTWFYTSVQLEIARRKGVYATAEDGMRALVARGYTDVEKIEIVHAGVNAFDGSQPHVWYVIVNVWAAGRVDGIPIASRGYDSGGSYFLHVKEGWVHVPEGAFPEVVGFGMQLFGLCGSQPAEGDPANSSLHEPSLQPST